MSWMAVARLILNGKRKEIKMNKLEQLLAERAAIDACGEVDPDCMIVTTLSPCNRPMDERHGESCEDLIAEYGIKHVYCGYKDPSQKQDTSVETENIKLKELCKKFADTFL